LDAGQADQHGNLADAIAPAEMAAGPAIRVKPSEAIVGVERGGLHMTQEMELTMMIMGFGLVALLVLFLMSKQPNTSPLVLRVYVITIIIFGTLAVVASAYTNDQIAPVVGLFGTIAGYVLGRSEKGVDGATAEEKSKKAPGVEPNP